MRKFLAAMVLACLSVATPAAAQVVGPVYPAPGGNTFSTNGQPTTSTARVGTYNNFDLSASGDLYFGFVGNGSSTPTHGLAMDGAINEPGEQLSYNASLSNLLLGQVTYTGNTGITTISGENPIQTRLVLTFTDLTDNALSLTYNPLISATDPLLLVLGGFKVAGGFEASSDGVTWTSANTFYNNYPMKPQGAQNLVASLSGGFYYTSPDAVPEPGTWAMMLLGFGGIGYSMRRRKPVVQIA